MKRTLKVLLGVVALALMGVSTASAQTGALLGKDLFLFDGGTGTTQNYVQLISPDDATLLSNWTLTLPPDGGGLNYILVNTDGAGTTEWQDGLSLFWGIEGNCDAILPWDPTVLPDGAGNYIGHCLNDLDFRSGGSIMRYWFGLTTFPVFTINENGTMTLQTGDGYEGLVIGGQPGGTTGPDAGIVIDCALPPTVGIEINALSTGILMPTACAPDAPLTGIDLQAQTLGIRSVAPTALWATGTTQLDGNVDINLAGGQFVNISGTTADATATEILLLDASSNVVTRTIGAGAAIVTGSGTQYTLPLWVDATGTEIGNSIVTQDAGATTATVGGNAVVTGTSDLQGNVSNSTGDLTLNDAVVVTGTSDLQGNVSNSTGDLTLNDAVVVTGTSDLQGNVSNSTGDVTVDDNLVVNGNTTLGDNGADVVTVTAATVDITNVPTTANTGSVVLRNGGGDLEVSSANFVSLPSAVTPGDDDILVWDGGSWDNKTLTAGTGIDVTIGASDVTISVENPVPAGTTNDATLRWSGSAWVENTNLLSTAAGNTSILGTVTLDPTDVGNDETDTRILTVDPITGLVSYRTIAANGTIPTAGTLNNNEPVRTNGSGQLVTGAINLAGGATEVSGVLPIANGGTNSSTALNNNRIMVSSGGAIVEAAALTDGQLLIGSTGGAPTAGTITAGTGISVTNGAGTITIANTAPTVPAPAVGNTNWTLRSDGSAWVASGALQNNGTNVSMTGNLDVDGNLTLGTTDANTHSIIGVTNINTTGNASTTIGNITSSGTQSLVSGAGSVVMNSQAGQAIVTGEAGFTINSGAGNAGNINTIFANTTNIGLNDPADVTNLNSPTVSIDNVPTSALATNLLRRNASGDIEVSTATFPTTSGALGNNTALRTNGSGQIESVALTNGQLLIGSTGAAPVAATPISTDGSVTITTGAGSLDLEVTNPLPTGAANQTLRYDGGTNEWVATSNLSNDGTDVQATGNLFVGNNLQVGDVDGDQTYIRGAVSINTGTQPNPPAGPISVNVNTSTHAHITTIGSSTAGNTTNLNSPTIVAPNLPPGANTDQLVTVDGTGNIRKATVATMIGGTPWLRGGNAGALSGTLGTTDAVDVDLTANAISHINLNTADQSTEINTTATGDVTIGVNTVNAINLNSDEINAPNLPDATTSTTVLMLEGNQIVKKDLGTPVQKTYSDKAVITGTAGGTVDFTIDVGAGNVFGGFDITSTNSIVMITVQDGTDGNNYTATVVAIDDTNDEIDIRLSGVLADGATKFINYTIVNP